MDKGDLKKNNASEDKDNGGKGIEKRFTMRQYYSWFFFFFIVITSPIIYSGIVSWRMARHMFPTENYLSHTYLNSYSIALIFIMDAIAIVLLHYLFKPLRKLAHDNENGIVDRENEQKAYLSFIKLPRYGIFTIMGAIPVQVAATLKNTVDQTHLEPALTMQILFILLTYVVDYYWAEMEVGKRLEYFTFNPNISGTSAKVKTFLLIILAFPLYGSVLSTYFLYIPPENTGSILFVTAVITVPITFGIALMLISTIIKPIERVLKYISEADFDIKREIKIPILSADEFGKVSYIFQDFLNKFREVFIKNSNVAMDLKRKAEELAASIEELTASSQNIASIQQEISKGAQIQVSEVQEIQSRFDKLFGDISEIKNYVANIGDLTETIREISQQTNMLALNAAIEAARAGEAGKGFNIVAEQVRRLAAESKEAMQRTAPIIQKIQGLTEEQADMANQVLKRIDKIINIAEMSSSNTEESAAAAEEQSASMEQLAGAAQELLRFASELESVSRNLRVIYSGSQTIKEIGENGGSPPDENGDKRIPGEPHEISGLQGPEKEYDTAERSF